MIRTTIDAALVTDIDLMFGSSGKAYARFRAVSKERKRDVQGKWVDGDETFFSVTVFGKQAEMLAETNPEKGTRLLMQGTAKIEEWTGKDGNKRQTFAVIADSIALDLTFTAYSKVSREAADRGAAARSDEVSGSAPF